MNIQAWVTFGLLIFIAVNIIHNVTEEASIRREWKKFCGTYQPKEWMPDFTAMLAKGLKRK